MAMKVKAVEKLLKFDKNSAGVYPLCDESRDVLEPEPEEGDQGGAPSDHLMMISLQEFGTSVFFS